MIEKNENSSIRVMMVNSDLTSNGGIASVIKSLYRANALSNKMEKLVLLKTNYYNDRNMLSEVYVLLKALLIYVYYLIFDHIDIVHIHTSSGISFFRKSIFCILAKLLRKKTIFHIHASNFYDFFICPSNSFRHKFISKIFIACDLVIVLCQDWKDQLENCYKKVNIISIPNPITISEYKREDTSDSQNKILNVLFLGFLIKSKGINDLIETARILNNSECSMLHFYVAGKGPLENELVKKISLYKLTNLVEFVGWANDSQKKHLLDIADVLFLPSYKEGMPISILEAMASGCAILSTRISGIPEIVLQGVNGYLTEPGDIPSYCEYLLDWCNTREDVISMGSESFRLVQKYDTNKTLDRFVNIYSILLK